MWVSPVCIQHKDMYTNTPAYESEHINTDDHRDSLTTEKVPWSRKKQKRIAHWLSHKASQIKSNSLSLFSNTHTFPARFLFRSLLIVRGVDSLPIFTQKHTTIHHFLCVRCGRGQRRGCVEKSGDHVMSACSEGSIQPPNDSCVGH